jgi:hypothetical protein
MGKVAEGRVDAHMQIALEPNAKVVTPALR